MLGLFLLLPVLAIYARGLPDYSPELLGLAMGAYGLAQAALQIPFGRWSDRYGRKPLITVGLVLYAAGSLLGAMAHTVTGLLVARLVQGAGAVSASVTALLADLTRAEVRTRAMAFVGVSIGVSFIAALVLAPVLDTLVGVPGIFLIMLAMALGGLALLFLAVPAEPGRGSGSDSRNASALVSLLVRPELLPLYAGVFALHFIMTATFLGLPQVLVSDLGLPVSRHWTVYLGVFVASLAGTVPLVLATERDGSGHWLFVASVLVAACAQALLGLGHRSLWGVLAALTLFFAAFNYLEARLPALITQSVPGSDRGAALGIFATSQFLGAFLGGALGGLLLGRFGVSGVFWGTAAAGFAWAAGAAGARAPFLHGPR